MTFVSRGWIEENIPAINISYIFVSMPTELGSLANLWQTKGYCVTQDELVSLSTIEPYEDTLVFELNMNERPIYLFIYFF